MKKKVKMKEKKEKSQIKTEYGACILEYKDMKTFKNKGENDKVSKSDRNKINNLDKR